jgi:NAD(P)-dependent dehydrogenase (short-subunit alcohol dehydrogenase family)
MSLKGKTLFTTGASRGIGLAIALRRAQDIAKRCPLACSSCRGNFQATISRSMVIWARAHLWFACRRTETCALSGLPGGRRQLY